MNFFLAILPLLLVLIGMIVFHRSGTFVSIIGWILSMLLAVYYFKTPWSVVWGATAVGVIKALGITLAVIFTMFLIFLMKETQALAKIIEYVKGIAKTKEEQALFIGMGFGSLSTALGMVTPAMFPPIFRMLGFSAISAIAISVLCYDPLTSFALFSIPITLPSNVAYKFFGIHPPGISNLHEFIWDLTFKITVFLPPISVLFAFIMLYMVGGAEALRKNWVPALLSGLVLSLTALVISAFRLLPVEIIGIAAGFTTMLFVYFYYKKNEKKETAPRLTGEVIISASPFILLTVFSLIINIPSIKVKFANALGKAEVFHIFANKYEDLNILAKVWFWIFVVCIISIFILRPSKEQFSRAFKTWITRIWGPFLAYSLFFAVAFIMAWSAMDIINGKLAPSPYFKDYNMDRIIAQTLHHIFGSAYAFISPLLGLIGAFIGGSETASNVLFAKIQWEATLSTAGAHAFMWIYAAHAVGGGIASAITPSKITNAAATIGVSGKEEGKFIKAVLLPVLFMILITGIMVTIFIHLK